MVTIEFPSKAKVTISHGEIQCRNAVLREVCLAIADRLALRDSPMIPDHDRYTANAIVEQLGEGKVSGQERKEVPSAPGDVE